MSDDSSFFCAKRKKNELKTPTPSQAAPDSPGGACRNANAFRASPRLHCIPSLRRYALRRIALRARITDDFQSKLDAQKK